MALTDIPAFVLLCDNPEKVDIIDSRFGPAATLNAVTQQEVPQIPGAANCEYPDGFEAVLNRARGIAAAKERSPRLWVASAMVIRQIPANYNAWLWRRKLLFERGGKSFVESCVDDKELNSWFNDDGGNDSESPTATESKPHPQIAFLTDAKMHIKPPLSIAGDAGVDPMPEVARAMLAAWAPTKQILLPPLSKAAVSTTTAAAAASSTSAARSLSGGYCVCRAAAWELANCKELALNNVKGFQAWNHRRDVLERAAALWNECPCRGQCGVPFGALNEIPLTESVLLHSQKNYHVWLHRSWFLSFSGVLLTDKGRVEELDFANRMITYDVFNNSAWTHRGFIFRFCLAALDWELTRDDARKWTQVREFPKWFAGAPAWRVPADQREIHEAAARTLRTQRGLDLVLAEMTWALGSAAIEPRNEAPFSYISGMLALVGRSLSSLQEKPAGEEKSTCQRQEELLSGFLTAVLDIVGNETNFSCKVPAEFADLAPHLPDVEPPRLKLGKPLPLTMMTMTHSSGAAPEEQQPDHLQHLPLYPDCLRRGTTRQMELTAPTLYRDDIVFQIRKMQAANAATSEAKAHMVQEMVRVGTRLCTIDPYRRKYWSQEIAAAAQ